MADEDTTNLNFRIPTSYAERIDSAAQRRSNGAQRLNRSDMLRIIISDWFDREESEEKTRRKAPKASER